MATTLVKLSNLRAVLLGKVAALTLILFNHSLYRLLIVAHGIFYPMHKASCSTLLLPAVCNRKAIVARSAKLDAAWSVADLHLLQPPSSLHHGHRHAIQAAQRRLGAGGHTAVDQRCAAAAADWRGRCAPVTRAGS